MPAGTLQTILVCVPGRLTQAPCPRGQSVATLNAYVLDPSQKASYEAFTAPFDYALAAGIWAFAFSFVLGLFLVSKSMGTILAMIRR